MKTASETLADLEAAAVRAVSRYRSTWLDPWEAERAIWDLSSFIDEGPETDRDEQALRTLADCEKDFRTAERERERAR